MKIISWNILHIIHEENYVGSESLVITDYPVERLRIEAIVKKIVDEYQSNDQVVINLQEVPGDCLNVLKELFVLIVIQTIMVLALFVEFI